MPLRTTKSLCAHSPRTSSFALAATCAVVFAFDRHATAAEPTKDQCVDANEAAQALTRSARLIEAKQNLLTCVATTCPGPIREDCAQQLSQVELKMPTLVFEAKDETNRDLSAVRVMMDGRPLVYKLDGTEIPLDPGEHTFVFQSQGRGDETRMLVLREGDKNRHEQVVLKGAGGGGTPLKVAMGGGPGASEQPANAGRTERAIGVGLGAAGATALVVGAVFGIAAKSTYGGTEAHCGTSQGHPSNACDMAGYNASNSAHDQATASTAALIGGAVLLGAGAYFYLSAPKPGQMSVGAAMNKTGAGLSMRGWW